MTDTPTLSKLVSELTAVFKENRDLREEVVRLKDAGKVDVDGFRQNKPKLNTREVENIRSLKRSGYSQREIADIYDINPATVSRIVRGLYHGGRRAGAAA